MSEEQKRTEMISARFSPEEVQRVRQLLEGQSMSEYLRSAALTPSSLDHGWWIWGQRISSTSECPTMTLRGHTVHLGGEMTDPFGVKSGPWIAEDLFKPDTPPERPRHWWQRFKRQPERTEGE